MPCDSGMGSYNSYGSGPDYEARTKVELLARVSCDIMAALENAGIPATAFSPETQTWWKKHKEHDARRVAAEEAKARRDKAKADALSKLTPAERNTLGL